MSDELPPDLGGANAIAAIERATEAMRRWQKTPAGQRAMKKHERELLEQRRVARQELCNIRGIPLDMAVRRWAYDTHPTGPLFKAVNEAIRWKLDREKELRGPTPAMRFLVGAPGTGKTSALAWAVAEWERSALYVTADVLCRNKDESAWRSAGTVSLLVLDELGVEPHADRITELMLKRYNDGQLTLCGSNLTWGDLMDRYMSGTGARLLDRMAQQKSMGLAPRVKAEGESYRGQKPTQYKDEDF